MKFCLVVNSGIDNILTQYISILLKFIKYISIYNLDISPNIKISFCMRSMKIPRQYLSIENLFLDKFWFDELFSINMLYLTGIDMGNNMCYNLHLLKTSGYIKYQ